MEIPTGSQNETGTKPGGNPPETHAGKALPHATCHTPSTDKTGGRVRGTPLKRSLPDDFQISQRVADWAASKGYTRLPERLEHFVSKAKARGYTYADWDEAFMQAIRKDWAELAVASSGGRPGIPPGMEHYE